MASNRLTFKATLAQVSVPATSANLGPGFDTFGLALDLRDRYAAQILDDAVFDVDVSGESADEVKKDKNNLVIKSMLRGFEFMGQKPRGIALRALNVTPHSRGLGSSASAIVGGLALARDLVLGGEQYMSSEELLALATELEGHPDNVAAAIHGGATIAWMEDIYGVKTGRSVSIPVHHDIKAILFIPESHLSTSKARKLLPETVPHRDAVLNSSHTAMLSIALSTRPDLLLTATEDFLHQSYRAEAYPKSMALVVKLRAAGVAATISGAGPSVLVLHTSSDTEVLEIIKAAGSSFSARELAISRSGIE
ncbi:MAG TPA: homoserine kinase [Candidatus Nanopelagicaceae bacterium]